MSTRFKRYKAKFDPETVKSRFQQVKDLSLDEEAKYQPLLHNLNMKVKKICCEQGVPSILHHYYVHYMQELLKLKLRGYDRIGGADIDAVALKWYAKGLNTDIMSKIASIFGYRIFTVISPTGIVAPPPPPAPPPAPTEPDPLDYAPPEGWTHIWYFDDPSELDDCFNSEHLYATVEDGLVKFNPPEGEYGYGLREVAGSYAQRVAICFRIKSSANSDFGTVTALASELVGDKYYWVQTRINATKICLYDGVGEALSTPIDLELEIWYVHVFDYPSGKHQLYKNNTLLLEQTLSPASPSETYYGFYVLEGNHYTSDTVEITDDVEVTWIAVREAT